jgi:hypothetical protein
MTRIEVRPASLSMVQSTVEGDRVRVDEDVQNVARDLREIDAGLKLEYDTVQRFYAVKWEHLNGRGELVEKLVLTALELDARIVGRVRIDQLAGLRLRAGDRAAGGRRLRVTLTGSGWTR